MEKRYCISEDEPDEERPDGAYQQEEPGIGQFVFLHEFFYFWESG